MTMSIHHTLPVYGIQSEENLSIYIYIYFTQFKLFYVESMDFG